MHHANARTHVQAAAAGDTLAALDMLEDIRMARTRGPHEASEQPEAVVEGADSMFEEGAQVCTSQSYVYRNKVVCI